MSVVAAIRHVSERFGGHCLGMPDEILLRQQLPPELCPEWLVEFLKSCPIIGTTIELSEEDDLSGQGAEMLWMPAHQIVDEMVNASPVGATGPLPCPETGAQSQWSPLCPYFLTTGAK